MKSLSEFKSKSVKVVFTDIDGTLTENGRLPEEAYSALWQLFDAGVQVIPVTGRPAGWCEMIARLWPVHSVIGENGGFYFSLRRGEMFRHFALPESELHQQQQKLAGIRNEVLAKVPGTAVASDQFCRLLDLAIDFCEDVPALPKESINEIVRIFEKHGAHAKISSIHVNGWFGNYDKLSMCRELLHREFNWKLEDHQHEVIFVGDSPNDEPMFAAFEQSFAVANVRDFLPQMKAHPAYISPSKEGKGFAEIAMEVRRSFLSKRRIKN